MNPSRSVCLLTLLFALPVRAADFEPARTEAWPIPLPDLYDVDSFGDSVWAVGYWGSVLRSSDAGDSWTQHRTPTSTTLFAVSFADAKHGWAVGNEGVVLHTQDGGVAWERQRVEVADEMGGTRPLDAALFGVAALSPTEAWAVGDFGTVIHTTDGERWQQIVLDPSVFADDNVPERIFNEVTFSDAQHGWIAGEFGTLLRTSDGGQSWVGQREIAGAIADIYLFDLAADADGSALAGGVGGVLIWTRDGGATWNALEAPTDAGLFGTAWQGGRGIVVGDRGVLLVSADSAGGWAEPKTRPHLFNWLRAATLVDGRAFAVGERGLVLRSKDGGASWEVAAGQQPLPTSAVSVPEPPSHQPGRSEAVEETREQR
jgi:photosystem II stability/assembly factor-like uncharacterized protein